MAYVPPHNRFDEDRLPHGQRWRTTMCRTERSQPPTFYRKKTTAAGEPRAGRENVRGYVMPSAIHSWHICQTKPKCKAHLPNRWIEVFKTFFCKNKNAKVICKIVGVHACNQKKSWPCLLQKFLQNRNSNTFICIWQILSNHGLTRFKIFVLQITDKPCN